MEEELDEIFYEIGKATFKTGLGAQGSNRLELIEIGKKWLTNKRGEICNVIKSDQVQYIFKGAGTSYDEQLRLLIDVIVSYKYNIPPSTISKAIITLGETWFCETRLIK
jgi:hypothetical protein